MTPTTPTPTPAAAPLAAPPRGLGAAVHKDLYRADAADPVAEKARLAGEARVLGLGFFVFFFCLIGGLSLWLNGGFSLPFSRSYTAATDPARGGLKADAETAGSLGQVWLHWSDGSRTPPAYIDHAGVATDDVAAAVKREQVRVRIVPQGSRKPIADVWAPAPSPQARVRGVERAGAADPAARSFPYAVRNAKLLWVIPTRAVLMIGAVLGLLGVVAPALLIPFYKFWMRWVAAPLGWFNTRLILGVVFFLMFTPFGLVLALYRSLKPETDPLRRTRRDGSYWKPRDKQRPRDHFEHSF
jgi:hypothetical protein